MNPPLFVDRSEPDVPEADHEDVVGGEAAEELRQDPQHHLPFVVDTIHLLLNLTCKLKCYEAEEEVRENFSGLNCAYVNSTGTIWTPVVFTQFLLWIIASRVTYRITRLRKFVANSFSSLRQFRVTSKGEKIGQ